MSTAQVSTVQSSPLLPPSGAAPVGSGMMADLSRLFSSTLSTFTARVSQTYGLSLEKVDEAWNRSLAPPSAPVVAHRVEMKVAAPASGPASASCVHAFTRGKNKGGLCGKKTVDGSSRCKAHSGGSAAAKPATPVGPVEKQLRAKKNYTYNFYEIAIPGAVDESFVLLAGVNKPYAHRKGNTIYPLSPADLALLGTMGTHPAESSMCLAQPQVLQPAEAPAAPVKAVEPSSSTNEDDGFDEEDLLSAVAGADEDDDDGVEDDE
jgi:hypothetical protein